jgi:hypothetical protein
MSKRPHKSTTHLGPDPAAGNIRDPEQRNDELERHDTPRHEDPTQRNKPRPPKGEGGR